MHPPTRHDGNDGSGGQSASPRDGSQDGASRHGKFPLGTVGIVALVAVGIVALVVVPRLKHDRDVKKNTQDMAVSTVTVLHAKPGLPDADISLPGNVQPFYEASISARTNGYLRSWKFDIGAHVKAGDLLAEIETPEVDQQLDQAKAALLQTQANLALAKTTSDRWTALYKTNAVAEQELQEKQSALAVQQANLAAAEANVKQLAAEQSFQKIVAPFDGIVTSRTTDVGALINAGSAGAGQELFRVAQIQTLRVYVSVPEAFSQSMKIGAGADISLASAPGVAAKGIIADTAGAIDPQSRTLLVQLQVPNTDEKLLPGGYAQVHFKVALDHPPLVVPANTLIFRGHGTQVGVVGGDGVIALRTVQIGRDFGNTVELTDGVTAQDQIILNPSDSLTEGLKVDVKEQAAKPAPDAAAAPKK